MQSLRPRTDRVRERAASAKSLPPFTGYGLQSPLVYSQDSRPSLAPLLPSPVLQGEFQKFSIAVQRRARLAGSMARALVM
jgi:hypothetical protein